MKKGFTLMELLAVIVLLALLALIVVPIITNIITDSKRQAFEISARYLLDGAKKYLMTHDTEIQAVGKKNFVIENKNFVGDEIPMNGELPNEGELEITSVGTIQMAVNDEVLCAVKGPYSEDLLITSNISNCTLVEPTPESCFVFNGTTNTITDYLYTNSGCLSDVVIPDSIGGKSVINIGNQAFSSNNLTSVIIPNTVTSIGSSAFSANQITIAIIPNSVLTMGSGAFNSNLLTNVNIPNRLTVLNSDVFRFNQLTNINIPSTVTSIGDWTFQNNQLTNVTIPNSVTAIGRYSFLNNQLESVVFSNNLVSIGDFAFWQNRLTNINIPTTVTSISIAAFNNNLLPDNQAFIYARNANGTQNTSTIVSYGGAKKDNVIIPTGVTTIREEAFRDSSLTSISIPSTVTSIGNSAFNDNSLPDNQALIYKRNTDGTSDTTTIVSYGGAKKDNVVIPTGVTTIKDSAFYSSGLTGTITIPSTVTTIEQWAFGMNLLTSVSIPSSVTRIENYTFICNFPLESVTLPNTITYIGSSAFFNGSLTSIFIPNSVTTIGSQAFMFNTIPQGSAQIDRASGSVSIGSSAFSNNGPNYNTTITPTYLR